MSKIESKMQMGQYMIDPENQTITLTDQRFYRSGRTGNFLPSSSTILNCYPKSASFYEWLKVNGEQADEIRDEAGRDGSIIHNLTERYDKGERVSLLNTDGTVSFSTRQWSMFERYVEFSERYKPTIIMNEENLVSDNLGYGGTLDRIINLNGNTLLIDIKTSNSLHNHYWLQMASYVELVKEFHPDLKIDGIAILWLNAKTRTEGKKDQIQGKGWQMVFPDNSIDYYMKLFKHTQVLYNEENANAKPHQLTYKLEHIKNDTEA
jgi:hypothetical protein